MARRKPKARETKVRRDVLRCRLALDLMAGSQISAATIRERYYKDVTDASFHKTFKRDRQALELQGIYLLERNQGPAKMWSLDTTRTFASATLVSPAETRQLAAMLRPLVTDPANPCPHDLGCAISRMSLGTGSVASGASQAHMDCDPAIVAEVAAAIHLRRPVLLSYQSLADKQPVQRELHGWGLFALGGSMYVVGARGRAGQPDAIRTYNLARAVAARVASDATSYEIPEDFSVEDWRLLPFEIGTQPACLATMYVPRTQAPAFLEAARKRGEIIRKQGGSIEWNVMVRDTMAAARWAIEVGIIPLSPSALVETWESLIKAGAQ